MDKIIFNNHLFYSSTGLGPPQGIGIGKNILPTFKIEREGVFSDH